MAGSRLVYDFTHNASARFRPPYWVKGEDSSFGFLYAAAALPQPRRAMKPQPCRCPVRPRPSATERGAV